MAKRRKNDGSESRPYEDYVPAMDDIADMTEGDDARKVAQEATLQLQMHRHDPEKARSATERYARSLAEDEMMKTTVLGRRALGSSHLPSNPN